jgi:hypothetical protein
VGRVPGAVSPVTGGRCFLTANESARGAVRWALGSVAQTTSFPNNQARQDAVQ